TRPRKVREDGDPGPDPPPPPEPTISVGGFEAHVTDAGWYVPVQVDDRLVTLPIEENNAQLAAKLVAEAATLQHFRKRWIDPPSRQELIDTLVSAGYSPSLVQRVDEKEDYDLYDVLGELGWGMKA